jgi:hypothetical protein
MNMKYAKIFLLSLFAAFGASAEITIEQQKKLEKMRERTVVISRKRISVGGKEYFVEQIRNPKDGREWRTNEVFKVSGKEMPTSWSKVRAELENKVALAEGDAKEMRDLKKVVKKAGKNLDKVVKTIEKAYEKSSSDEERELYAALLSVINGEGE